MNDLNRQADRPNATAVNDAANALILIVEDDPEIALILSRYLEAGGYRTLTARDGDQALMLTRQVQPDLMLLDLNLPRRDGFAVLSSVRAGGTLPVIVVSAMAEDVDKLTALKIGADDYVTKPFNPREVIARVAAVLRRVTQPADTGVLRAGNLTLDPLARRVTADGTDLGLTDSEYRLLAQMMYRQGRAFSRADLLDACFEDSTALERTVDSHISHLRRKMTMAGANVMVGVVRGFGYRLDTSPRRQGQ